MSSRLSCPGKVFLLGEYGILAGLPAWILALGPRFGHGPARATEAPPHPESPAGRLLAAVARGDLGPEAASRLPQALETSRFEDAHAGLGGFGGSTAEFALWAARLGLFEPQPDQALAVWQLYRQLTASEPVPPSGADLAAQWLGGLARVQLWPQPTVTEARLGRARSALLVFSAASIAGRKVATHRHLPELRDQGLFEADSRLVKALSPWTNRAEGWFAAPDSEASELGAILDGVAEALAGLGLELPATREDRAVLRALPGVLGVKGAGALQADALLVLCKPEGPMQNQVIQAAEARGLRLVSQAPPREPGLFREE